LPRKTNKAAIKKPENPVIRAFFYIAFLAVLFLTIYLFYLASAGSISLIRVELHRGYPFVHILYSGNRVPAFQGEEAGRDSRVARALKENADREDSHRRTDAFALLFLVEIIITLISALTGVSLSSNAQVFEATAPLAILLFSVFIAPLNEEIFFRGFLVPRFGIFIPALIFAILHSVMHL